MRADGRAVARPRLAKSNTFRAARCDLRERRVTQVARGRPGAREVSNLSRGGGSQMEPPARDGSIDSVLLESMPPRANGVVPSLHALCCELIGTTIINLDNAPSIVAFARAHNFPPLLQRAERFCCDSWSGLRKQHDAIELEQAVGTELFASLDKDQDDIEKRLRSMRRLGSVVDAPPAASASCSVPQAPKSTLVPAPAPSSARTKRFASFGGGGEVCLACSKRVYPAEMPTGVSIGSYHANCFRCATCVVWTRTRSIRS